MVPTMLRHAVCLAVLTCSAPAAIAQQWTLTNPTGRTYKDEVVRLKVAVPANAKQGDYVVTADGREVAYQVGETDGQKSIYVAATLDEDQAVDYEVKRGRPKSPKSLVQVKQEGNAIVLDNGQFAVRLPTAASGNAVPCPILAVRLPNGKWVGEGQFHTARTLKKFSAETLGSGPVFGKVRLTYQFEGNAGLHGNVPSFAAIDVLLMPGHRHVTIQEAHEMDRGDYWELDCAAGWKPRRVEVVTHSKGPGGGEQININSLKTGQTRMGDTLVNLQARWSQAFDEGWFFACDDGRNTVGAIPARASKWHWPHNNLIEVKVKPSADYAGLRCPTWKGRRYWLLIAGPTDTWAEKAKKDYVVRHAFQPLDKLHHDYLLDWPGLESALSGDSKKPPKLGRFSGKDFYDSGMNPTSGMRGFGRNAVRNVGKQGNLDTLTHVQVLLDNDAYGSYWNFWSSENPNFFTDFIKGAIALTTQLKKHPKFKQFAGLAEQKFHEDLYHSITLPGGAGQECPGYVAHAMKQWSELAPVCREHLGFDPTRWPRFKAGASFLLHLSQPIGGGQRRCHPGGDTHPLGPDVFAVGSEYGVKEDIRKFKTEELPGFGVVFRNKPDTGEETYLAFKSGPNRGHYHGDQLSFHYCANARQVAIDHMCSYGPRAGQEHMHNRVAFHTDKLPYANMDGYERVIALKTSNDVDIAVGQVESDRLRTTTDYPPEEWDVYLPEQRFDTPLVYRRTVVLLKNQGEDYVVIRDQNQGPDVKASYCLHVLTDKCEQQGNTIKFGNMTLLVAAPKDFEFGRHDWDFDRKDRSGKIILREHTKGVRLTVKGASGEFITVLYPGNKPPKMEAIEGGVRVGDDEIVFAGGIDDVDDVAYVTVTRGSKTRTALSGKDIDMDRPQGEIGLFVPDAGYPFGEIPDWLIRQRNKIPDWAPPWVKEARKHDLPK